MSQSWSITADFFCAQRLRPWKMLIARNWRKRSDRRWAAWAQTSRSCADSMSKTPNITISALLMLFTKRMKVLTCLYLPCVLVERSCSLSIVSWRFCLSSILRSVWKTHIWLKRWKQRDRRWGSASERTRNCIFTTRSTKAFVKTFFSKKEKQLDW